MAIGHKHYNSFSQALDCVKGIFFDMASKRIRYTFISRSDKKEFYFCAVEQADLVKSIFPNFDIRLGDRQGRVAELTISYDLTYLEQSKP